MRKFSFLLVLFGLLLGFAPKVMADNITSLDEITSGKAFTIKSPRGYFAAISPVNIDSNAGTSADGTHVNALWVFYKNADKMYLYSLANKAWVTASGFVADIADAPEVRVEDWGGNNAGKWRIYVGENTINMQVTGKAASINTWGTADDGNRMEIFPVRDLTEAEAADIAVTATLPSAANAMTNLGDINSAKIFYICSERGFLVQTDGLGYSGCWGDEGAKWQIYKNNDKCYLFNVAAGKFAGIAANKLVMSDVPTQLTIKQIDGSDNQWMLSLGSSNINMQDAIYSKQTVVDGYSTPDAGNKMYILLR